MATSAVEAPPMTDMVNTDLDLLSDLTADSPMDVLDLESLLNDGADVNPQSLEDFIDLKALLEGEVSDVQLHSTVDASELADVVLAEDAKVTSSTKKRTLSADYDHDYVIKRARVAPSVVEEEDGDFTDASSDVMPRVRAQTKHAERRRKNNIASRRSRETRKQKFVAMEQQAHELETSNAALRKKVKELEAMTKLMKATLVQRLAGR